MAIRQHTTNQQIIAIKQPPYLILDSLGKGKALQTFRD